jgi:hypothetical protein
MRIWIRIQLITLIRIQHLTLMRISFRIWILPFNLTRIRIHDTVFSGLSIFIGA